MLLAVNEFLLSDTDALPDFSPGVVAVTVSVLSVSSLLLSQRDTLGVSLTASEVSRVIFPGKAHVHEATMIQASFAPDI